MILIIPLTHNVTIISGSSEARGVVRRLLVPRHLIKREITTTIFASFLIHVADALSNLQSSSAMAKLREWLEDIS